MKRILSFVLVLTILLTSVSVFANGDIISKIEGHWSEKVLKKDFVSYYFPYLAKDNFGKLKPDANINKKDFSLSFGSLANNYNLDNKSNNLIHGEEIKRIEIVNVVGEKLKNIEELKDEKLELPFKDINNLEEESIELIKLLYNSKIINGVSEDSFAPDKVVTQAEAIVILQRVKGVLEDMKEISFEVKGVVQSYNSQENVFVKEKEESVLVTITKQFSTPGYSLGIEKIVKEDESYKVMLDIEAPAKGTDLLQVITYKTITIEVDKAELSTQAPYNFTVEGIKGNLSR